ncbi:hypothetical protein Fmac_018020 [Flemingia macrophylla]|uniref:Uncharacterized protein n=1 Tax=Flemingia macrophylla TaxID=520843 RepID=A0ABD1M3S0_9FABA
MIVKSSLKSQNAVRDKSNFFCLQMRQGVSVWKCLIVNITESVLYENEKTENELICCKSQGGKKNSSKDASGMAAHSAGASLGSFILMLPQVVVNYFMTVKDQQSAVRNIALAVQRLLACFDC